MQSRFFFVFAAFFTTLCVAGEFNTVLSIGDSSPSWEDLPGTDGSLHSLSDLKDQAAIVVVFTCNSCPYAVDVEDRLIALQKKYGSKGVKVIAINVNKVDEDLLPAMKEKAKEKGFNFTYLFDETQQIGKDFGAKYTPEFFVVDTASKIAYMGSLDDSPDGRNVTKRYVEKALDAVLAGEQPTITETVPIGCRVRYERVRRKPKK